MLQLYFNFKSGLFEWAWPLTVGWKQSFQSFKNTMFFDIMKVHYTTEVRVILYEVEIQDFVNLTVIHFRPFL